MKIVSVDIIDVKNPLQSAVAKWRPVVVRINTDEGISGFGEVGLAYGVGASAGFGMAQDFAKLLIGLDPMRNEFIWDKLQKKTFWGQGGGTVVSAGMSAIDVALWDIKGKPSLSKYFLIANQEGTEKINGHPISARKEKSNPRENPFQGDYG